MTNCISNITIAVGKGRLAEKTFELLAQFGIIFSEYSPKSRKLIFESDDRSIKMVFVKATDVSIYVERGAADMGICGKDTLLESESDVYEMLDLGFGKCKFAVAMMETHEINPLKKLIVATKYTTTAKKYYDSKGISIEIIKLNGSVELAPIMGMSDVIVDIVETGKTLKEHNLIVTDDICPISARVIVNKASFKTKAKEITYIIEKLKEMTEINQQNI